MAERTQTSGHRFSPAMIGWVSVGVVVVIVVAIVLVAETGGTRVKVKAGALAVPAEVSLKVTTVPASVLDRVGIEENTASSNPGKNPVNIVARPGAAALPPVDGKPAFFFYGAEWCPYCATERWSIIVALSRFGTFKGLTGAYSSPTDVYPSTQTLAFQGSTYTSPYLTFLPVEAENMNNLPLDSPNAAETRVLTAWDPKLEFPFIDIAGRYLGGLPTWDNPQLLAGLTRSQIAQMLWEPTSPLGSEIDANANYLTAATCDVDGERPSQVCRSIGVEAAAKQLKKLPNAVPIT